MNADKLGEFDLIARLTRAVGPRGPGVVLGAGDDTAVLRTTQNRFLLATCDVQIEGIHFTLDAFSPRQIGRRVAAVNLSDIAAMGGTPTFAIVSLAVPAQTDPDFLDGVYGGLNAALREWGAEIVGGNTSELPERIAIDVTLLGEVPEDRVLTRAGAKSGDLLCVTGFLGASAAGLELLGGDRFPDLDGANRKGAMDAHLEPTPRVAEGKFLGSTGQVTSCIDISDGLYGDASHIAEESGVTVCIEADRIPIAAAATGVAESVGADALQLALRGGEDYELLFTVPPAAADDLIAELAKVTNTRSTVIGEIQKGSAAVNITKKGQSVPIEADGFDHFKR
ncbi:MAG: thiamine-phosphate kinase [Proteobacteria bacterium]|nr:thiamine-phosphate kinase [Pseudomonadota bacterium]